MARTDKNLDPLYEPGGPTSEDVTPAGFLSPSVQIEPPWRAAFEPLQIKQGGAQSLLDALAADASGFLEPRGEGGVVINQSPGEGDYPRLHGEVYGECYEIMVVGKWESGEILLTRAEATRLLQSLTKWLTDAESGDD